MSFFRSFSIFLLDNRMDCISYTLANCFLQKLSFNIKLTTFFFADRYSPPKYLESSSWSVTESSRAQGVKSKFSPHGLNHIKAIRNHILNRESLKESNFLSSYSSYTRQIYFSYTKALCLHVCFFCSFLAFVLFNILIKMCIFIQK